MAVTERTRRVLIVDDHALVRSGLSELIGHEAGLEVCGEASDAATALTKVKETQPDIVIVDIMLKEGSGVELIKQIRALDPSIRMLVTSMHDERLYAERVLNAGAMGYVSKQEPAEKVIQAIRQVLAGRVYVSEQMADRVLRRVSHGAEDPKQSPLDALSDRELEVLNLIGQGLSTRQIAEQLHLSVKTIDTYREHIKSKLNLKTANELVRYAVAWTLDPSQGGLKDA
jgi:DNA-binding NarL/FixJ family response regulator